MPIDLHTAFVRTQLTPLNTPLARAVFVAEGGTLIEDQPYELGSGRPRLMPHALDGLRLLGQAGYRLIVVSQRPGLASGMFSRAALSRFHAALGRLAQAEGVRIDDFHVCPHAPAARPVPACLCRVPAPGLLRQAARSHGLDLSQSWMLGDTLDDIEAGRRAGCHTAMLDVGKETEWRMTPLRRPDLRAASLLDAAEAMLACDAVRVETMTAAPPMPSVPIQRRQAPAWLNEGRSE
jgi:D-glycero-D-manno-heptose 1,7-bisphosphate phosphatase